MMRIIFLVIFVLGIPFSVSAQDTTTVEAKNEEISKNLDLEAVASVFGEAETLEDFEKRLNDPETQITNLDLNEDGEVDYLRVLETVKGETHFIAIQAVIGEDQFQDVATIEVEKDQSGETQVQVVGDVAMYGPTYIVEPVYVHPPIVFMIFWTPYYSPWYSPWYWGYPSPYYHPWHPYPTGRYRTNVNVHINVNNSYNYTSVRKSKTSVGIQKKNRRNDYGKKKTDRKDSGRKVDKDWKSSSKRKTPEKGKVAPGSGAKKKQNPALGKSGPAKAKPASKTRPAPKSRPHTRGQRRR